MFFLLVWTNFGYDDITGAFRLYDVDNDGFITRDEMYNIVDAIYQMVVSKKSSRTQTFLFKFNKVDALKFDPNLFGFRYFSLKFKTKNWKFCSFKYLMIF